MSVPPFQEILVPALAAISMNKTTALDTLGRIVQRFTLPGSSLSLTGPVPAPDPGQDPYSSDKKGGDSLGIRGRLFWAVFFLEREGFVRASAPGSYSATVKGRRALPLMLSGLGKGTLKRYPALRRLVPSPLDKGEGGAGKAGPGNGGIDLSGLRPWEGAVPPTDPELALSCLKASLALAGHAAKDGRDLKALSLRHLSEDRARAGEPPADPRDPQLPKRLRAAAQSLKACGLLARASRGDAQGMATDQGRRAAALDRDALERLMARLSAGTAAKASPADGAPAGNGESAAAGGVGEAGGPGGGAASEGLPARGAASDAGSVALGDLDEAASMLKDQDISATASKIRGLTRKAFRRLAKALAVVAARREGGPARGLPFFDIREGDSKAAAKRLEAYAEDAENNGFKDWALFTLGKLGPAGREAVARSSPRIKAAGSMQIAGLMHEYGLAVKTLPAFEFKRVDRGFFASLPRGKDGAGKGAPAPPRGKPEAAASAAPEDGPKPAPGAPDGGPRCGPRPDALNPDGTAPDGTPAGGPSEGRGRAYAPDTGDA